VTDAVALAAAPVAATPAVLAVLGVIMGRYGGCADRPEDRQDRDDADRLMFRQAFIGLHTVHDHAHGAVAERRWALARHAPILLV